MLKIISVILCVNVLSCENKSRPKTELYDAFSRFVQSAPTLFGYKFTEQDEELYAAGSTVQDVHLEIDEIIPSYGYLVEKYEVASDDGYILRMFRIRGEGRPVFLMHGLMMSSDDWVTPGPESGLAYLFAAEGFDVWLGNARGNKHSRSHITLPLHSAAFWNFSWDEIGRYDLPAMIDFVLRATDHSQLLYVGHSQGTTAFFVMASERPEYNDKISLMVALAPAAGIPNLKSPILQFINYGTLLHPDILFAKLRQNGLNELTQRNAITKTFAFTACAKSKIAKAICDNIAFPMCGINYLQLNLMGLPTMLSHLTSEVAVKQIEHYAQTVTYQRFAHFDYGVDRNYILYGTRLPPVYNISAITTPVVMLYSAGDWLASEVDTHILRKKLGNVVYFYKVPDEKFTHLDFMYAKDVRELVFAPVIKQIRKIFL